MVEDLNITTSRNEHSLALVKVVFRRQGGFHLLTSFVCITHYIMADLVGVNMNEWAIAEIAYNLNPTEYVQSSVNFIVAFKHLNIAFSKNITIYPI